MPGARASNGPSNRVGSRRGTAPHHCHAENDCDEPGEVDGISQHRTEGCFEADKSDYAECSEAARQIWISKKNYGDEGQRNGEIEEDDGWDLK